MRLSKSLFARHWFRNSKTSQASIELIEGNGVRDDAHFGITVKHRSRVAKDPSQPNLRQVHLMHQELFDKLVTKGFEVLPGQIGENVICFQCLKTCLKKLF